MTFQESQKPKSSHDFPLVQDTQVKRAIVWVIIQPMFFFFFYPSWLPGLQTKTGSVDASGGGKVFSQKVMEAGSEGGGGRGGEVGERRRQRRTLDRAGPCSGRRPPAATPRVSRKGWRPGRAWDRSGWCCRSPSAACCCSRRPCRAER